VALLNGKQTSPAQMLSNGFVGIGRQTQVGETVIRLYGAVTNTWAGFIETSWVAGVLWNSQAGAAHVGLK